MTQVKIFRSMKIQDIIDPTVFVALRRICRYLVDDIWNMDVGTGEIEAEFRLAKERSKRYEKDIINLSKIDLDLNWGQTKTHKDDKRWSISQTGDFNPWYKGDLNLEDLLNSLESIIEFLESGDERIEESEFIHYYKFLKNESNITSNDISYNYWSIIHPDITKVAQKKFFLGLYAESVRTSLVEIEDKIRKLYKAQSGRELSGDALMREAFSPNNPVIPLDDISNQEGKDIQKGYMEIFCGSMIGIRNPKSHRNFEITKERAVHFLFLSSLLMFKLDERINP